MKQSDITPKVIELSKEIAEYWRVEIYEGCWLGSFVGNRISLVDYERQKIATDTTHLDNAVKYYQTHFYPIPSISDCLEKLRELGLYYRLQDIKGGHEFGIWDDPEDEPLSAKCSINPLEACQSALLEVLKGEGK